MNCIANTIKKVVLNEILRFESKVSYHRLTDFQKDSKEKLHRRQHKVSNP